MPLCARSEDVAPIPVGTLANEQVSTGRPGGVGEPRAVTTNPRSSWVVPAWAALNEGARWGAPRSQPRRTGLGGGLRETTLRCRDRGDRGADHRRLLQLWRWHQAGIEQWWEQDPHGVADGRLRAQ